MSARAPIRPAPTHSMRRSPQFLNCSLFHLRELCSIDHVADSDAAAGLRGHVFVARWYNTEYDATVCEVFIRNALHVRRCHGLRARVIDCERVRRVAEERIVLPQVSGLPQVRFETGQ